MACAPRSSRAERSAWATRSRRSLKAGDFVLRRATPSDAGFLQKMLVAAVNWDAHRASKTPDEILSTPSLSHYVAGWQRSGDGGVIAEEDGVPMGAAWFRLFERSEAGFGFVDDETPELSIAVDESARGRGIGRALLRGLLDEARSAGHKRLSLSVEIANEAADWYRRVGFREVRRDGDAVTMSIDLEEAKPDQNIGGSV